MSISNYVDVFCLVTAVLTRVIADGTRGSRGSRVPDPREAPTIGESSLSGTFNHVWRC